MKIYDYKTAAAFANSWNNLPLGSIYTMEQFSDWMKPITEREVIGKRVLELGCGNGSLLLGIAKWGASYLEGVDLGESVESATKNLQSLPHKNWKIIKSDLVNYNSEGFDIVYCVGVLHHLIDSRAGFEACVRNTKSGGKFHCWVYAREGNGLIVYLVDPLRKIACRLPWWLIKYFIAAPLVVPYFFYAKLLAYFKKCNFLKNLPLYEYSLWISQREFLFFRHVAFDQLVSPRTKYFRYSTIAEWLNNTQGIQKSSIYIKMRNGNSWIFGGTKS